MNTRLISTIATTLLAVTATPAMCAEGSDWHFDVSAYGLAAGMSGDITIHGITSDLDVGFDQIWDNLEFGAMANVRIGRGRWALATDVIYMGLGGSKNGVSADLDQWVVEPTLGYQLFQGLEVLAGARYNNISGEVRGPFGRNPSGTQNWWDPIVGANVRWPLGKKLSLNARGDIGGFGVSSDLTWQAFPYMSWQFTKLLSIQAGYRWVYSDYETGSGSKRFGYDVLTQGPQVGLTLSF